MAKVVVLFTLVCTLLCASSQSQSRQRKISGWQSYTSRAHGFSIQYPDDMRLFSRKIDYTDIKLLSYIPVCDDVTVACIVYNGHEYDGTNFQAAGLSVNVLRDRRLEKDCTDTGPGSFPITPTVVQGRKFLHQRTGGAGLGNELFGEAYWTFYENVCFEVTLSIATSAFANYDPGTIKEFHEEDLQREMKRMLHSFAFVGHVASGSAWKVYRNEMVGGSFEYPDIDSVQKTIEYSKERFYSNELTDSAYFADHGLGYTVAAKANVRGGDRVRDWLKSSGYPSLSEAGVVNRSRYFTEYKSGYYFYFVGQATLYILSVSDEAHRVIDPEKAPLFSHFLNSFTPD